VAVTQLGRRIAGFRVVSCDIFDTAVMRVLARPEDVLLAVGARLRARGLAARTPEAFRDYRLEAERAARRTAEAAGHDEVRIAAVYEHLLACGVVRDAGAAAAIEFAVECAACRPVEPVRAALLARTAAQRLVFVSDSMLPGNWLAVLLADCGYGPDCTVYSSADARRSKHTGRLFAHVIGDLGCRAGDIVHIGDNRHSDIARATEVGITALFLPRAQPPPETDAVAATEYPVRLAHSHRRSRVATPAEPTGVRPLHHAFAMLLIGFTLHVLAEARRRGIRRIYFLARDGHLPMLLARRLVARSGQDVALRYLHVSRQSIVVPASSDQPASLVPDIAAGLGGRPLATALECIGVSAETMAGLLRDIGLDPGPCPNGAEAVARVERLFTAQAAFVTERLHARRAAALGYLGQEGLLDAGPHLVVDVGWRGTTQRALDKLTGAEIAGCYLGLWPNALGPDINPRTASGYLFAFGHPKRWHDVVREGFILLEMVFSAPHGTVTHYEQEGGRFVPKHATESEPGGAVRRAALAALEAGCLAEFDALDDLLDGAWPERLHPASALFDADALLTRPTLQEVKAINTVPFINAPNGRGIGVAINPVGLRQLLLDTPAALRRFDTAPWRSGAIRLALPWPIPAVTYHELVHRFGQVRRLIGRG
jgi:FMN phosphatase YigB (HAD superfamily)